MEGLIFPTAFALGGVIATFITAHIYRKQIAYLLRNEAADTQLILALAEKLEALRSNAYLTNEHGHRVRYHKASAEVRARAEAE